MGLKYAGGRAKVFQRSSSRLCREQLFTKNYFFCALTPELSRTDLRHGGVVHVSAQAEPRSGLGLNELLGWGQLLSDATMCHHANADLNAPRPSIRCAFANCKRVPRHEREDQEQDKSKRT